jgi:hypothetical protein
MYDWKNLGFILLFICVYVYIWVYAYVRTCPLKPENFTESSEAGVRGGCYPICVVGTELGSSSRAGYTLNHWTISTVPWAFLFSGRLRFKTNKGQGSLLAAAPGLGMKMLLSKEWEAVLVRSEWFCHSLWGLQFSLGCAPLVSSELPSRRWTEGGTVASQSVCTVLGLPVEHEGFPGFCWVGNAHCDNNLLACCTHGLSFLERPVPCNAFFLSKTGWGPNVV